ncbi:MAG: hypothetical protein JO002_06715 [Burkholderiaceae bacterium]|nr:hypothetical protein [Burkholderiaceae bacterium]
MKRISRWLLGVLTFTPFLSEAQVTCPKELKWIDATYAERKITRNGQIESAKIEAFLNASVIHVTIGNVQSGMIEIFPKNHADSIRLTFGRDRPKPSDFDEVSMLVEPPMTNAAWPRMKGPCAVSSGADIEFDESDAPDFIEAHTDNIPKFKGVIRRDDRKRITSTVLNQVAESAMILITPLGSGVQAPESLSAQFQGRKSSTRFTG